MSVTKDHWWLAALSTDPKTTPQQLDVARALAESPCINHHYVCASAQDLVFKAAIPAAEAKRLVDDLERRGYLRRLQWGSDRRPIHALEIPSAPKSETGKVISQRRQNLSRAYSR